MEIHLAEAARKLFNGAEEDGLGRKDFAAVHEFIGKV
jgi:3-hydroxyisobutyrate dehydrogenase-like beta-hydroxyacid dehydrogenase